MSAPEVSSRRMARSSALPPFIKQLPGRIIRPHVARCSVLADPMMRANRT